EPAEATGALGHQPRSERAVTITRHIQRHRAGLGLHRLGRSAIAGIGQRPPHRVALLIAQMIGQLRSQPTLQSQLDQPGQQAPLTGQRNLAGIDLSQQIVHHARHPKRLGHLHGGPHLTQCQIRVLACRHALRSFRQDLHRPSDTPDGHGVVSHAGMGMVRELADRTGLSTQVTVALADTYRGPWVYAPGDVFADLAAAVADGADCIDGVGQLCGDREHVFGAAASTTTMWRLVDERIDAAHRAARAAPRAAAWDAGAAPADQDWLHIDLDATLVIDHSDNKAGATPTWKKTFGHHPLLAFLDRPEIAGGEALGGLLRTGNAGANTASDHIIVLEQALAALPPAWQPDPDQPGDPDKPK